MNIGEKVKLEAVNIQDGVETSKEDVYGIILDKLDENTYKVKIKLTEGAYTVANVGKNNIKPV